MAPHYRIFRLPLTAAISYIFSIMLVYTFWHFNNSSVDDLAAFSAYLFSFSPVRNALPYALMFFAMVLGIFTRYPSQKKLLQQILYISAITFVAILCMQLLSWCLSELSSHFADEYSTSWQFYLAYYVISLINITFHFYLGYIFFQHYASTQPSLEPIETEHGPLINRVLFVTIFFSAYMILSNAVINASVLFFRDVIIAMGDALLPRHYHEFAALFNAGFALFATYPLFSCVKLPQSFTRILKIVLLTILFSILCSTGFMIAAIFWANESVSSSLIYIESNAERAIFALTVIVHCVVLYFSSRFFVQKCLLKKTG